MFDTRKKNPALSVLFSLVLIAFPSHSFADCAVERETIYRQFIDYREQINTASRLEDLTGYFSENFKQYFTAKLGSAAGETNKNRYLAQYWDNLNTAKDIVIVFDYSLRCDKNNNKASLSLVAVLSSNGVTEGQEVELWNVTVNYLNENQQWKIDSFKYKRLGPNQKYLATGIKNNFVLIH